MTQNKRQCVAWQRGQHRVTNTDRNLIQKIEHSLYLKKSVLNRKKEYLNVLFMTDPTIAERNYDSLIDCPFRVLAYRSVPHRLFSHCRNHLHVQRIYPIV